MQLFSAHALTIYVAMHKQKAPTDALSRSKAPKPQQNVVPGMREKPVNIFIAPQERRL